VNGHLIWLWLWFFIGALMYWVKRAYYGVTPPNPVATSYAHYLQRSWAPLLVRFFVDSMIFWALFTPGFADKAVASLGWQSGGWVIGMVTQFAVFASIFGFFVDAVADIAVTKIPWIKDVLPQMPGPLGANVNVTDQNIVKAKQQVDAAAGNLKDVPSPTEER
jgi:hypothetical protein